MFRIGEFSKIAQVSGRQLRFYDEIGLLSPDFTDPQTGYRYYSAQQLPRLNRILVLKELGLSLEQISQFLERDASIDEIRGMLALRKAQIEQTLQEEASRLRMVESRLQQLDTHGQIQEPDIIIKSVPAQYFLSLRETLVGMDMIRKRVQRTHAIVPTVVGQSNLGPLAVVLHSPSYDPDALDVEVGYLLTGKSSQSIRLSEDRFLTVRELPAVETMATLIHVGPVDSRHQAMGALGTWIEQNGWRLMDVGREILMSLPIENRDDQMVVEFQFPISRTDEKLGA